MRGMSLRDRSEDEESTGGIGAVALAWLPAGDYEQACGSGPSWRQWENPV